MQENYVKKEVQFEQVESNYRLFMQRFLGLKVPIEDELGRKLFEKYYQELIANIKNETQQPLPSKSKELLENQLRYSQVLNYFGRQLLKLNKNQESRLCLEEVIRVDQTQYQAFFNLGVIKCLETKVNQALSYFQQALKVKPDYYRALNGRAVAFNLLGKTQESIQLFKEVVRLYPLQAKSWNNLGYCYGFFDESDPEKEQRRYIQSIKCFSKTIQVNPKHPLCFYNLGLLFKQLIKNVYQNQHIFTLDEIQAIKRDCAESIIQLNQKAKQDSLIFFNMSLFFSSIDLAQYKRFFGEFIRQFIKQQSKNQKEKYFNEIFNNELDIYKIIYNKKHRTLQRQVTIQKIVFCDTLELVDQFMKSLHKLLNHYQLNDKKSVFQNEEIIDRILQQQPQQYPDEIQRQYIPYILKYLMIKFKKDSKYRYMLFKKYDRLCKANRINSDILLSTVFAMELETMWNMIIHYQAFQDKLRAEYYQLSQLSFQQLLFFYNSYNKHLDSITNDQKQINQNLLQEISERLEECFEDKNNQLQNKNSERDYFYQVISLDEQFPDFSKEYADIQEEAGWQRKKAQLFNRIAEKYEHQKIKEQNTTMKNENIKILQQHHHQSSLQQRIKMLIGLIYVKISQQQTLIDLSKQNEFYQSFYRQRKELLRQFLTQTYQSKKSLSQHHQEEIIGKLENILKSFVCRSQILWLHNSFFYFFSDQYILAKFYDMLQQIYIKFQNKQVLNLKHSLNDLLNSSNTEPITQNFSDQRSISSQQPTLIEKIQKQPNSEIPSPKKQRRKSADIREQQSTQLLRKLKKLETKLGLILPLGTLTMQIHKKSEDNLEIQSNNNSYQQSKKNIVPNQKIKHPHQIQGPNNSQNGQVDEQDQEDFQQLDKRLDQCKIYYEQQWIVVDQARKGSRQTNNMSNLQDNDNIQAQKDGLEEKSAQSQLLSFSDESKQIQNSMESTQRRKMNETSSKDNKIKCTKSFSKACNESEAKLPDFEQAQDQEQKIQKSKQLKQLIFKNHAYLIRYLSARKKKFKYIAKYRLKEDTVEKNQQKNQYLSFKFTLTKGNKLFVPLQKQPFSWYSAKIWSKGIKQVLYWIYCIVSAVKQLQYFGIFHLDLQFRNTILASNKDFDRKCEHKYKVIDFDYAFKVYQTQDQLYKCAFDYTKSMIKYFLRKDSQLSCKSEISTTYISYMFPDMTECKDAIRRDLEQIIGSKENIEVKVQLIHSKLQKYMFVYHKHQLENRIDQLMKYQMEQTDKVCLLSVASLFTNFHPKAVQNQSYLQRLEYNHTTLYNQILKMIQKLIL